ncbi:helix-turn-helix transcriptional regulator [Mycobacterium sp. 852002-51057_SCH5723018]|uniref:helix-turn-helix transcriptional regulator n=1 Tax=Mycobacterium sp. 852002-51057_SCH5723018 TaxID=1834094 RepID=UPI0008297A26|nr:helix-turn-helix transcriptional regulator [Mycobacterium sp. 852002-51057_SCH5723018]
MLELADGYAASAAPLARELYLEALSAVLFAGRLSGGNGIADVAMAAKAAPGAQEPPRPSDRLLDGLTTLIIEGPRAGVGPVRQAVDGFCRADESGPDDGTRWLWLACHAAIIAWDHRAWQLLPARQVTLARVAEDRRVLPVALHSLAAALTWSGDFEASRELITEANSITTATATTVFPYAALPLAAWRGDQRQTERLIQAGTHYAVARGEGMGLASIGLATALLCNGLGHYDRALVAARKGIEHPQELWTNFFLPELIEAATRCGQLGEAADALELLAESALPAGTDWALGIYGYSRALVTSGRSAELLYHEAIERLDCTNLRPAIARARLVYGEWLRRERRPRDARAQLRVAFETFTDIGMAAYAERTRLELEATGQQMPEKPGLSRGSGLTPRESQIATMAAGGATNAEIGAQLFISANTVAYHLRKVFTKLDVTARRQLAGTLREQSSPSYGG